MHCSIESSRAWFSNRRRVLAFRPPFISMTIFRSDTIMEIVTQDAFGLLYRMASVISGHGCNIEVALITTEGHRAIDVFYITREGKKLSQDEESQVEADLNRALAPVV